MSVASQKGILQTVGTVEINHWHLHTAFETVIFGETAFKAVMDFHSLRIALVGENMVLSSKGDAGCFRARFT